MRSSVADALAEQPLRKECLSVHSSWPLKSLFIKMTSMESSPFCTSHLHSILDPEDVGNACFYNGVIRNECAYLLLTES